MISQNEFVSHGCISRGLWAVALAFLSVGGWLSYDEAAPVDRPQLASAVASVRAVDETPGSSREAAPVEYLSKPISQLRTMHDRVLAQPFLNIEILTS